MPAKTNRTDILSEQLLIRGSARQLVTTDNEDDAEILPEINAPIAEIEDICDIGHRLSAHSAREVSGIVTRLLSRKEMMCREDALEAVRAEAEGLPQAGT